ncbi:hypothetical protein AVEN_218515-1 [Araneus ventricosus]|uniref:Secreted protein n=1 Tax=Araneus ventricosus TaxID=182803 RepID=A0A4Y2EVR0_ARAVE|nr:hypothetical protein AVEN_218515-1 [Araneus ventricosus]
MFALPALLYLKLLPLFGQCLYHLIVPINPVLHMLVERLSPCWSSTGRISFLGRQGKCGYFCTSPGPLRMIWRAAGPHTWRIFGGIVFRAWDPPAPKPIPYH